MQPLPLPVSSARVILSITVPAGGAAVMVSERTLHLTNSRPCISHGTSAHPKVYNP